MKILFRKATVRLVIGIGLTVVFATFAGAHSNNMKGLALADARYALEKGDVTPVLKWVKGGEKEITQEFKATVAARNKNPKGKEAIDLRFYETFIKVHRECYQYKGCAPFTAIDKESDVSVVTRMADDVIGTGAIDMMAEHLTREVDQAIRARYAIVAEKAKHKNDSLAAGREFVEAYLELSHYVEHLDTEAPLGAARKDR